MKIADEDDNCKQEVLMKKTDVDPVDMFVNGLKGTTLAATMLTFCILCQEVKEDWPECEKVKKAYSIFKAYYRFKRFRI